MGLSRISLIGDGALNSIALYMQVGISLTQGIIIELGLEKIRPVRSKMDCMSALGRMVPNETEQLEIHQQLTAYTRATGTFGKPVAKVARDRDQPGKQFHCFY